VADPEAAACECVQGGAVARAVVCEYAFDLDAVAAVEGDRAVEKGDRRGRFLVVQDLGVGQAAVVVDGDVHELPADGVADSAGRVGVFAVVGRVALAADPFARATDDPAELLHVDVDELAGT